MQWPGRWESRATAVCHRDEDLSGRDETYAATSGLTPLVDVVFLFPVALIYGDATLAAEAGHWRDFTEVTIFVGILSLAIVYAYRKGVFRWE